MAEPTLSDDRDVRWLVDLLALLPAMNAGGSSVGRRRVDPALDANGVEKDGAEWWKRYAKAHQGPTGEGVYYCSHLLSYALAMVNGKADDGDVRRLAEYCLVFFAVAYRPECCELLEEVVVTTFTPDPPGSCGRRWAESVVDVACRLWTVRQSRYRVREGLAGWPQQTEH